MLRNPSLHNIDPRIGVAWDPFKDHKTSVRAGYGVYHAVLQARDYAYGGFYTFPYVAATQTSLAQLKFPTPFTSPVTGAISATYGMNPYATTPYLQQWNLSVQREIMRNTVVTVAYVGSHGVHLLEQAEENPPAPAGGETLPGAGTSCGLSAGLACGGISVASGTTIWPSFPGEFQSLVALPGSSSPAVYNAANGTITCAAGCTLATANQQPIIDPATGQPVYSHIVQTGTTTFSVQSNNRLNPFFGAQDGARSTALSHYNALQASFIRRMTNNFSLQVSYTYSDCIDTTSGSNTADGGTNATTTYDLNADRGPCNFMVRQNVTTNGLYELPFTKNQWVAGWQLGGVGHISILACRSPSRLFLTTRSISAVGAATVQIMWPTGMPTWVFRPVTISQPSSLIHTQLLVTSTSIRIALSPLRLANSATSGEMHTSFPPTQRSTPICRSSRRYLNG